MTVMFASACNPVDQPENRTFHIEVELQDEALQEGFLNGKYRFAFLGEDYFPSGQMIKNQSVQNLHFPWRDTAHTYEMSILERENLISRFLVAHNDQLSMALQDNGLEMTINNRELKRYDLSYVQLVNQEVFMSETRHLDNLDRALQTFRSKELSSLGAGEDLIQRYLQKALDECRKEKDLLDSLYKENLLSGDYYTLKKSMLELEETMAQVNASVLSLEEFGELKDIQKHITTVQSHGSAVYGELLEFLSKHYGFKVQEGLLLGDLQIKQRTVDKVGFLDPKTKEIINQRLTVSALPFLSVADRKEVLESGHIQSQAASGSEITAITNVADLSLISTEDDQLSLSELLAEQDAELVVLSFWASWCPPCFKEFSFHNELADGYNPSQLRVIDISLDKKDERWRRAIEKWDLDVDLNFRAVGEPWEEFLMKLDVSSIPRYVLLDRGGIILHGRAPRPSTGLLTELIDQELKQR